MGACILHHPRSLPPASAVLPVQETRVALLPLRPLLLCHHPQLYLLLDLPWQQAAVHRVLSHVTRFSSKRSHHLAKQSRVPRPGQGYFPIHPYLCTLCVYGHPVGAATS